MNPLKARIRALNISLLAAALIWMLAVWPQRSHASVRVPGLTARDVKEIRALNEAYRTAWLRNDRDEVMRTLSKDAVIIPSGLQPVAGTEAIVRFWWPDDGSKTTITGFTATIDEIGGDHDFAYVLGTHEVSFTYEKNGNRSNATIKGVSLTIVARQPNGAWLISRRMWTTLSA